MTYVLTISNVLDEDTGDIGAIHVEVPSKAEGEALRDIIIAEEGADPKDFVLVDAPTGWDCTGHGDGVFCVAPRLN